MRTEMDPDPKGDRRKLEVAYADPGNLDRARMFQGTDWEFTKPRPKDIIGVLASVAGCFVVIGFLLWLAGIGG